MHISKDCISLLKPSKVYTYGDLLLYTSHPNTTQKLPGSQFGVIFSRFPPLPKSFKKLAQTAHIVCNLLFLIQYFTMSVSDQCKEIEENHRMGKTRDLFKKIIDTKGTFHAKMGSVKDRKSMDLIEAYYIKKRWQEYTEKQFKKDLNDQIIMMV